MKRSVFYSWQSDLPSKGNRNFIEAALNKALGAISRDKDVNIEPVLDRDTADTSGAADIAGSIFAKIAAADVFVADVSLIGTAGSRDTPNPNVLVELGYAVAELGWENIILVLNGEFGGPERLPFDLRGRLTVVYRLNESTDRSNERGILQGRLEAALRAALLASPNNLPTGRDANLWWGEWHRDAAGSGTLSIFDVGTNGFTFNLDVYHGSHQGSITGFARLVSRDLAYIQVANGDGERAGEIAFRRSMVGGLRHIDVDEISPCDYWRGARAYFSGCFRRGPEPWFDAGLMNEIELARFYRTVGEHIVKFRQFTSDIGEKDNVDEDKQARVIWGAVPGLYTISETIVVLSAEGGVWAAYIDEEKVRYFTNIPSDRGACPKTIDDWRAEFASLEVVYTEPDAVVRHRET
ncbi:hypothetical protein STVA_48900 [Allostella vacuolata]|nr:hypothetical protein STVA_48900 [Stella vacuolata]